MRVRNVNGIVFQGATVIKSKNVRLINFLNDIDYDIFRKSKKPIARFDAPAGSLPKDGFWTGILAYGKDAECIYAVKTEKNEEIEIKSVADILNIAQLKIFKSRIKEYSLLSSITNKL